MEGLLLLAESVFLSIKSSSSSITLHSYSLIVVINDTHASFNDKLKKKLLSRLVDGHYLVLGGWQEKHLPIQSRSRLIHR